MTDPDNIQHIDAADSAAIEEVTDTPSEQAAMDPVMSVTVALANELQNVYANDPQKLEAANRSLRSAVKGAPKPKH
jgi:hypothetical protein